MRPTTSGHLRSSPTNSTSIAQAEQWHARFEQQDSVQHFRRREAENRPDWAQLQCSLSNPFVRRVYNCLQSGTITACGVAHRLGHGTVFLQVKAALPKLGLTPLTISERRLEELLAEGERSIGYLCERLETSPLGLWTLFHRQPRYCDPRDQREPIHYSDLTPWCDSEALARAVFKGMAVKEIAAEVYNGSTREFARIQLRSRNLMPFLRLRQELRRQLMPEGA
jgi:hypothetical protein